MIKLAKYLKPYVLLLVMIIVCTFGQVQAELALPTYMSNIITNGIQNNGLVLATPIAIRQERLDHILLFLNEDEQEIVQNAYTLSDKGYVQSPSGQVVIIHEPTYVLNDLSLDLSKYLERPLVITGLIKEDATQFNIPEYADPYEYIQKYPNVINTINTAIDEQYNETTLHQSAIAFVKAEYKYIGITTDKFQSNYIFNQGIQMLLYAALSAVCAILVAFLASKIAVGVAKDIRRDVFTKVESFSINEMTSFSTASLITRTTNDVQQLQQVVTMLLRVVLMAPMMGIGAIIKVVKYPSMLWILILALVVISIILFTTFKITLPKFKIVQKLVDRLNLVTREFLDGILVIRAFNTQEKEASKFDVANKDITSMNLFINRVMATVMPSMNFVMSSISILIVWVAASQIEMGTMQIGDMLAFIQYSMHVLSSFLMVSMIVIMVPRASVSADRINQVLNTKTTVVDTTNPISKPETNQDITFEHVSFKYPKAENNILDDISFVAHPGETVAFIGSTGSGKSTLVNLLPRFFDPTEGTIKIGETNIKDFSLHDLRSMIGYIPQKAILFSGDVKSNVAYGNKEADDALIENSLKVAQAKSFVDKKEGLNTDISQGATNLSGGQKQRIAIARALCTNANIYIFDDSFSALDYKTDAALRKELSKLLEKTKATAFIVGQRIASIMSADQIIVLDEGKIVGSGKHADLLKNCKVYKEIATSQLSKEELKNDKK